VHYDAHLTDEWADHAVHLRAVRYCEMMNRCCGQCLVAFRHLFHFPYRDRLVRDLAYRYSLWDYLTWLVYVVP
jgi:hypothetical protein